MTRGEEIHTAIERRDATALRRMAEEARTEETRMLLNLLAEVIDQQPKKTTQLKRTAQLEFVSSGLAGRPTRCHEVQFYSDDASFLDGFTRFIIGALQAGNAAIVIATESHRDSLFQRLQAHGLDVSTAEKRGSYISLDVADTLSKFMVNDFPEPSRFLEVASGLVSAAAKATKGKHPRVAACGECAPVLLTQGKADAAIRLEQLWDGLARTYNVDILCGYPMTSFRGEQGSDIFQKICAEHSAVYSQ